MEHEISLHCYKKKDSSFFFAWNSLDSDIETIKVHADEVYGEDSASFKLHFWAWDSHKLKTTRTLHFMYLNLTMYLKPRSERSALHMKKVIL